MKDYPKKQKEGDYHNENGKRKSETPLSKKDQKKRRNPTQELLYNAKLLYESIKVKDQSTEERQKKINDLTKLLKGKTVEVIFKHDASRVIQTCIKWGNDEQRKAILTELKGKMVDLAKSRYAHFLAIKIFKYAKSQRDQVFQELKGNIAKLLRHKEANPVIEYLWTEVATPKQKTEIFLEFCGARFLLMEKIDKPSLKLLISTFPDKRHQILSVMKTHLLKTVDKGAPVVRSELAHFLLLEYFENTTPEEAWEVVDSLKENLVEIVHTKEGAKAGVHCISNANAKDRKTIIKGMKGYVPKVCIEEYAHLVILRLLDVVDDTVILNKSVIKEMISNADNLVNDKYGRMCFLFVLSPRNTKYFPPSTLELLQTEIQTKDGLTPVSKKKAEDRQKELLQFLKTSSFQEYCKENLESMSTNLYASQVLLEYIRACEDSTPFAEEYANLLQSEKAVELYENEVFCRLFKKLIKERVEFAKVALDSISEKHKVATKKTSSFIILALLDQEETKSQTKKELKDYASEISKVEHPGTQLISKILKS